MLPAEGFRGFSSGEIAEAPPSLAAPRNLQHPDQDFEQTLSEWEDIDQYVAWKEPVLFLPCSFSQVFADNPFFHVFSILFHNPE